MTSDAGEAGFESQEFRPESASTTGLEVGIIEILTTAGQEIEIPPNGVVLIVGPNNVGKSTFLRELHGSFTSKPTPGQRLWVSRTRTRLHGEEGQQFAWFEEFARTIPWSSGYPYAGTRTIDDDWTNAASGSWETVKRSFQEIQSGMQDAPYFPIAARHMCVILEAGARLQFDNSAPPRDTRQRPTSFLHHLAEKPELEDKFRARIKQAFRFDVAINRYDPAILKIRRGSPLPPPVAQPTSREYLESFDSRPDLASEGDGVRSFINILASVLAGPQHVTFIDEPEAFLHPPQAQLLGRFLVTDSNPRGQVIAATHSRDVIKGVLDAISTTGRSVTLLRLDTRSTGERGVRVLDKESVRSLWSDPLLNYSRIVDGVFHRGVVVTENDADSRFYEAHLDAEIEAEVRPDLTFVNIGGKSAFPRAMHLLADLGVRSVAVADIDLLDNSQLIEKMCDAVGSPLIRSEVEAIRQLNSSVVADAAPATVGRVKSTVDSLFRRRRRDSPVTEAERSEISEAIKTRSGWKAVKRGGTRALDASQLAFFFEIDSFLRARGIYLVQVGELERFYPHVNEPKGAQYVNAVLEQRLFDDPASEARTFMREIYGHLA
ncbi:MAG: ATP-binding protein [Actinobacteria bacterium]|nr:ATP-binding protein [Actinomycetota bacterium]